MRPTALILALCASVAFAAEGVTPPPAPAPAPAPVPAPAPAPAGEVKAQIKELEGKLKAIREQVSKEDPALSKLKTEAAEARKGYETAVEAKLKDNADYTALKARIDELRGKNKKDGKDAK